MDSSEEVKVQLGTWFNKDVCSTQQGRTGCSEVVLRQWVFFIEIKNPYLILLIKIN